MAIVVVAAVVVVVVVIAVAVVDLFSCGGPGVEGRMGGREGGEKA